MFHVLQLKDNKVDESPPQEAFPGLIFTLNIKVATSQSSSVHLEDLQQSYSDDNIAIIIKTKTKKKEVFSGLGKVLEPDSRADGQKQRGLTQDVCINQGDSAGI